MLWWFAQTTLIAGALAVVATLAGRWKRLGPEARHALWLIVLIKLAIPPFVAWPWSVPDAWPARVEPVAVPTPVAWPAPLAVEATAPVPEISPQPSLDPTPVMRPPPSPEDVLAGAEVPDESQIPAIPDSRPIESKPEIRDPVPGPRAPKSAISNLKSGIWNGKSQIWNANSALLALWMAGSAVVVARRGIKVVRFHRSLSGSRPAPGWLVEEVRAIGERVGVRPPPVVAMSSIGTPLLWCLGRPRLILPESLIKRLEADRWPGILAHELAHLARRDHWVVRLELLVEAIWWWNPLFWHARRRLHEEAEIACDARVVRALPERRFAYAEALVNVCEHIARSAIPPPALGVGGAGASRSLEGRLLMILRDPLPHRPTRRASLVAMLLVALALPAWTLGQQPDAPPSKSDAPSEASPKPDAPADPSKPIPAEAPGPFDDPIREMTIDNIRAGFAGRRVKLERLAFRYSVASRDRPARNQPSVIVKVADVVLKLGVYPFSNYRLDILTYLASPEPPDAGGPNPGERPVPWGHGFLAQDGSGIMTFWSSWSHPGPVPFRWQTVGGLAITPGDDLAAALSPMNNVEAVSRDRSIDPLEPRPANVLDLAGAAVLLLGLGNSSPAQLDVAGVNVVEGREVVRVAWVSYRNDGNGGGGLRGLLWVAPSLGYAVVRSEATQDPSQTGMAHGRRTWRKTASDFTEVGGLWLPRKVEIRSTEAGRLPPAEHELIASFEDYRVNPELPPDTFHPKFKIKALDDQTGQFTTVPPKPSPSLIDRLAKAVRESKFGPPVVEKPDAMPPAPKTPVPANPLEARVVPQPRGAAQTSDASPKSSPFDPEPRPGAAQPALPIPGVSPFDPEPRPGTIKPALPIPGGRIHEDIVKDVDKAPSGRLMPPLPGRAIPAPNAETPKRAIHLAPPDSDAAKIDPRIIARPATGFEDPIPISEPKKDDPIPGAAPAPKPAQAIPLPGPGDKPATVPPGNIPKPAPGLAGPITEPRKDDPAPDKVPADQQDLDRQVENRFKGDPLAIDLASQIMETQKKLDEIRRPVNKPTGDPAERVFERRLESLNKQFAQLWEARSREFRADLTGRSTAARDEIDLLQIRRNRKAADVRKAEAQRGLALAALEGTRSLRDKQGVGAKEVVRYEGELAIAEAELASKQTELDEADLLLNQAKRRFGIAAPDSPAKERAPDQVRDGAAPEKGASPDGRDEVGLLQARRNGKAADVRKAEAQRGLAKAVVERNEALQKKNPQYVSREEVLKAEAEMKIADAEVSGKTSELEEADLLLKQANRRFGIAIPDPPADGSPKQVPAEARTPAGIQGNQKMVEIAHLIKNLEKRLAGAQRVAKDPHDPAILMARKELEEARAEYREAEEKNAKSNPGPQPEEKNAKSNPGPQPDARDGVLDGRDEVGVLQARRDGKAAEMKKAEARLERARLDMQRASNLKARNAIGQEDFDRITADFKVAEADVAQKKADLDEADVFLNQAKRRLGAASTSTRGSSATPGQSATLAEVRDAVELMEVQLQGKRAELRGAEAKAGFAKNRSARVKVLVDRNTVGRAEFDDAESNAKVAESELETKKAEVLEFEVRLKQARRRVELAEARLKREVERAKTRLGWSETMFKKGFVSKGTYEADKASYDELMIQLDPKYVPAPSVAVPDGPPPPAAL